ncbi:secretin N-terminal domain-containing protein [Edaphobacter aggregans]|nr:secretin N-terminal domain-containing protein [Edaphobacter aggregans]
MRVVCGVLRVVLAVGLSGGSVWAQTSPSTAAKQSSESVRTFYLHNIGQQADANEVVTALRNSLDPTVKMTGVPSQNAVVIRGTPDQLDMAQKLINELDLPKKNYRLTYMINEMDGDKRVGSQHFTIALIPGQVTTLKQGSKVPVVTGTYNPGSSSAQSQMTYLDVGMNFRASVEEFTDGVRLSSKVEQSSVAEEKSGVGEQDPIVRQTILEGSSILAPGKPLRLGSLDIPGSTRHLEIEVVLEPVR